MHIAILIFPGVQLLDVVGPMDVFSEAARQAGSPHAYRISLVGIDGNVVIASNGIRVTPNMTIADYLGDIDTLLVPGMQNRTAMAVGEITVQWLKDQAKVVRRLGSICSGAMVLANAGLLDGKRATTHWDATNQLAARFPRVQVEPDRPYIKDGQVYSSAGVTAGMDLALGMVEEDFGKSVAMKVARELIIFPRRLGGQLQFSGRSCGPRVRPHGEIFEVQEWVRRNLDKPLTIEQLALQAAMSPRNFQAKFEEEAKVAPSIFVESARATEASRLLRETTYPIAKICTMCGFSDSKEFRFVFRRHYGESPLAYRRQFAGQAKSVDPTGGHDGMQG
ncbi:GlxA family transcriptional regulator [Cupriavidus sp. 2TAF22]|uniref:GlxA family transcriptional regulator n=1 Tax=unclassified Cupriavidus TaxID=2640874 RepID=UPI003F90FB17